MTLSLKYKGNLINELNYKANLSNNKAKTTSLKLNDGQVALKRDNSLVICMAGAISDLDDTNKPTRSLSLDVDIIFEVANTDKNDSNINEDELKNLISDYALPSASLLYEELVKSCSSIDSAPPMMLNSLELTGKVKLSNEK